MLSHMTPYAHTKSYTLLILFMLLSINLIRVVYIAQVPTITVPCSRYLFYFQSLVSCSTVFKLVTELVHNFIPDIFVLQRK